MQMMAYPDSSTIHVGLSPQTRRWQSLLHRLLCCCGLLIPVLAASAELESRQQQREYFRQAWSALARADWDEARSIATQLADYPLLPYLRAEQMRQRSSAFSDEQIVAYLQHHQDWAFHDNLRRNWLRTLGRDDQLQRLLLQATAEDTDPEVRCHLARAMIAQNDSNNSEQQQRLQTLLQGLWLTGKSQHKACDAAFVWWRRQQGITSSLAWQRAELAMATGNSGLARYLQRFMRPSDQDWLQRWLQMHSSPANTLAAAEDWPDQQQAWQIAVHGLARLARSDHEHALALWQKLDRHFSWPAPLRAAGLHDIALFGSLQLEPQSIEVIDSLPETASDPQLLAWRARVALANELWPQVQQSVQRMPAEVQQDTRWRYWLAQAMQSVGAPDAAQEMLQTLSSEADYYGFLAADWLQQPYQICSLDEADDNWRSLPTAAQLERAVELHLVGLDSYAGRAWRHAIAPLDDRQRMQAATLAAAHEWWLQSVLTLAGEATRQTYALRFPLSYVPLVQQHAQRHELDPALVYGLMRAESAMNPQAISSANARGLMQVTPGTARTLSRRHGLAYSGSASLLQADTNIAFGTTYLAEMLQRYAGDPVKVLGAYNAGPHVIERWQQESRPQRPDIWIETLPYFETRDYIPRVLAFSVIYDWLLHDAVMPISARMSGMPAALRSRPARPAELQRRAVECLN
jgi:soluble lytic murein transglycosylase